jgi:hypothetical protein
MRLGNIVLLRFSHIGHMRNDSPIACPFHNKKPSSLTFALAWVPQVTQTKADATNY